MRSRPLLRDPDVRLIVGAVGISSLGDFLLWIPLTLHLERMTDSGIAVAALMVCLWSPIVLLAPLAGLLVDRVDARTALIVASLAQAAVAGSMALALDSVAAILVLATLLGIGFAVAQPAEFALVPVIARDKRLAEINGYVESARYFGILAGPTIGGALFGAGGTDLALLVNGISFLAVAVAGVSLRARRPPALADDEGGPDRARDGIAFLARDPALRLILGVVFISLLFMSASITAEVFFITEDLDLTGLAYGLLFSTWALGMVVGALVLARRVPQAAVATGVLVATAVQGFGLGAPTWFLAVGFAAAMWFVGGVGHGIKNVLARTLIQERVPDRLHGRAFAAYNGLRNGAELFALAGGGLLVAAIGGRATLALAGAVSMLAGLAGLAIYLARRGRITAEPATEAAPAGSRVSR